MVKTNQIVGGRTAWMITAGLLFMFLGLVLGFPMQSGPDEPAHMVRSAGLVRGDIFGDEVSGDSGSGGNDVARVFNAPSWVDEPNPACYAFHPDVSAACATGVTADDMATSTAASYPPPAHLFAGIGTLVVNGPDGRWAARLFGAIPTLILMAFAFIKLARVGPMAAGAAMLAVSPAAMMTMGVVNPSALTIAGTVALVTGIVCRDDRTVDSKVDSKGGWLAVAGFCAVAVTRSDGLLWAVVVSVVTLLASKRSLRTLWAGMSRAQKLVVALTAATVAVWTVSFRPALVRVPTDARGMNLVIVAIGRVGQHLDEGVGLFSWFDTAAPRTVFNLWWLAVGTLVGTAAVLGYRRAVVAAGGLFVAYILVGILADVVFGPTVGLVWQGRYELPLLISAVMLLGLAQRNNERSQVVGRGVAILALLLWNVTVWQALRRWGAGANGTILVWRWNPGEVAISPFVTIILFAVGSLLFVRAFMERAVQRSAISDAT